jgi:hypothetical protein
MPSLPYVGALIAVAALSFLQTTVPASAQTSARVQHVIVRGAGTAMEVEIQTSGAPVAPNTQVITGPDRIVVDFPGALPDAELRALKVNRGALKGVRAGLFFSNPPITRIVLDLAEPQSYQISTNQNVIVVKLSPAKLAAAKPDAATAAAAKALYRLPVPAAKLQNASLASGTPFTGTTVAGTNVAGTTVAAPRVSPPRVTAVSETTEARSPVASTPLPPQPPVTVTLVNGMLTIRTEKATLAQVLFEVQRQTQAEIAIPAGAEQEEVAVDLGPAPARDVLGALLNGSRYNFIFVGDELSLERVILTRRDASPF